MLTLVQFLSKIYLAFTLVVALFAPNAEAALSNGSDGAFLVSDIYTLNATNNQVFNFTTFDVLTGGTLDFTGLTSTDTITFLATGDINLAGTLNFSSNVTFETLGSIFLSGNLYAPAQANLLFSAGTSMTNNGTITFAGGGSTNSTPTQNSDFVINSGTGGTKGGVDLVNGGSAFTPADSGILNLGGGSLIGGGATPPSAGGSLVVGSGGLLTTGRSSPLGGIGVASVPEPSTYLQALCSLALMVFINRKKLINLQSEFTSLG